MVGNGQVSGGAELAAYNGKSLACGKRRAGNGHGEMSGKLRRACGVGHRLQPGCIAGEVFKGVAVEKPAPPQESAIGLAETVFGTDGVPCFDDAGEAMRPDDNSLLAGKEETSAGQQRNEPGLQRQFGGV